MQHVLLLFKSVRVRSMTLNIVLGREFSMALISIKLCVLIGWVDSVKAISVTVTFHVSVI